MKEVTTDRYTNKLPKKDLDQLQEIWSTFYLAHKLDSKESLINNFCEAQKSIKAYIDGNVNYAPPTKILQRLSLDLRKLIIQQSIYTRINQGDLKSLFSGIYTANRLEYFYPTTILEALINALSCQDLTLIDKYLEKYPNNYSRDDFWSVSHNTLLSLCRNDMVSKDTHLAKLETALSSKALKSEFDRSLVLSLKSLLKNDVQEFNSSLEMMIKSNKKKTFSYSDDLAKFICLPAHGLYNLAVKMHKENRLDRPTEPFGIYFDTEFNQMLQDNKFEINSIPFIDFSALSTTFDRWMRELPLELDASEVANY